MELNEDLVIKMKKTAFENPCFIKTGSFSMPNPNHYKCLWKASYKEHNLELLFTYEVYQKDDQDMLKTWHLSVGIEGNKEISKELAYEICNQILSDPILIDENHFPAEMRYARQFIEPVKSDEEDAWKWN